MQVGRAVLFSGLVAAAAAMPIAGARAQLVPPCGFFPLCLPFVVVGTAANIVTAPFRAFAPPPYYYPPPGYGYAPPPGYASAPPPGYASAPPPASAASADYGGSTYSPFTKGY